MLPTVQYTIRLRVGDGIFFTPAHQLDYSEVPSGTHRCGSSLRPQVLDSVLMSTLLVTPAKEESISK